ncbi:MAG TPA: UvrB/UvrC motif-containing protein [Bacillota bacterium]
MSSLLCERCHERPATVHLTKIINFQKTEFHLCEVCAKSAGSELGFIFEPTFTFQNLIAGLLEGDTGIYQQPATVKELYCPNCGLTFTDFRNNGLLGCADCYNNFQSGLEPLLKRVQGNTRHIGKVPKRSGGKVRIKKEIADLRQELQQSIGREDYERAAELRDEIRRREQDL